MEYMHPEVLVDTQWVQDNLKDSEKVRIAEVDYDPKSNYELGHTPGAVLFDWKQDINDPVYRNVLTRQACEDLLQKAGVSKDMTLILYGDFNNWFAAFAYCRIGERSSHSWFVLKYLLGYSNVKNYDGSWTEWGNMIANPIEK